MESHPPDTPTRNFRRGENSASSGFSVNAAMQVPLHLIPVCASDSRMTSVHHGGTWEELTAWLPTQPGLQRVVCDIYGTLLHVEPGPTAPEQAWKEAWQRCVPTAPFIAWEAMHQQLQAAVRSEHAQAARFHEVDWVKIFRSLGGNARLARHHARLQRRCHLMPGAAELIRHAKLPLSLCSNSQAYTLMEMRLALRAAGLKLSRFDLRNSFFSFLHLAAKPNPAIWQLLEQKFTPTPPAALLMVGDRSDNDIEPALKAGWSTWLLSSMAASAEPSQ